MERITNKKLLDDLLNLINLKRGIPFTIWQILKNPGKAIETYLKEDRSKYVNSFRMLALMVGLSTFIMLQFDLYDNVAPDVGIFEDGVKNKEKSEEVARLMTSTLKEYMYWFSFLMVPVLGLFTYLFFKRSGYNFAEQTTAQAYLMSATTALSLLLIPIVFWNGKLYMMLANIFFFIYHMWYCATLQTDRKIPRKLLAGFSSYIIAFTLYSIVMMFIVGVIVGIQMAQGR